MMVVQFFVVLAVYPETAGNRWKRCRRIWESSKSKNGD